MAYIVAQGYELADVLRATDKLLENSWVPIGGITPLLISQMPVRAIFYQSLYKAGAKTEEATQLLAKLKVELDVNVVDKEGGEKLPEE